ncbi:hypothetical protein [Rubripirellula lacrimiformis]|nr:hypothetical protein [Rubripirellula lacrimiformis]
MADDVVLYWDIPADEASSPGWLESMTSSIKEVFDSAIRFNSDNRFIDEQMLRDARNNCMTLVHILHQNAGMARGDYGRDVPNAVAGLRRFSAEVDAVANALDEGKQVQSPKPGKLGREAPPIIPPEYQLQLSQTDAARKYYRHLELSDRQKLRNFSKEIEDGNVACEKVSDRLFIFDARQLNPLTDIADK